MNLQKLVTVPENQRDQNWENQFFTQLTQAKVNLITEEPQYGPDSWPYLLAETAADGSEPVQNLLHWLSTRGIGLVINPRKEYPDYVFSFGMIWHFMKTGLFYNSQDQQADGPVEFSPAQVINSGPPSEDYLPSTVRTILKQFLLDQGIMRPKILCLTLNGKSYELAFSLEALGNPPATEHAGIAEALAWFLPPHYSILLVSEKGLPEFTDL